MKHRVIFISGWGVPPETLKPRAERPGDVSPLLVDWADLLETSLPLEAAWERSREADASESGPVVLLAWSLGGLLALRALCESSSDAKPDAVVLVGSFARFLSDEETGWPGAESRMLKAMTLKMERRRESVLRDFGAACWAGAGGPVAVADAVEAFVVQAERYADETLKAGLETLATLDVRAAAAGIDLPVLVVHGESDAIAPLETGRKTAELMPDATFRSLPGGHALPLAAPERVADAVRDFLSARFELS